MIHSHEEAGVVGVAIARVLRKPHVYDMGNDLSVVMRNYGFSRRHPLTRLAESVERVTIRRSHSVIAHFPSIARRVDEVSDGKVPATVAINVPIEAPADPSRTAHFHRQWSPDGTPVVLYTGTLEPYQGLPALIDAVHRVRPAEIRFRLVIVGGTAEQQQELTGLVEQRALGASVLVAGAVSQDDVRSCLAAADILVSPRATGSNTPLKLFSYMRSGRSLLATRIEGHLQVLDDNSACLVEPTAEGLARGLRAVLADPGRAADRARTAGQLVHDHYSLETHVRNVAEAYVPVGAAPASESQIAAAVRSLENELSRVAA